LVISRDVGRVFEPGKSESLFEAIKYMLENDDFWQQASIQARLRVLEKYNWEILAKSIITTYERVLIR